MGDFLIGALGTLFALLILSMFCFGPQIFEWLEQMPPEQADA